MDAPWITWLLLVVITIGTINNSIRFQRGTRRSELRLWRNPALPATLRQGALVMGPLAVICVPALVLSAPLFLRLPIYSDLPRHVTLALEEAAFGYLMLVCGLALAMAYRPPARFMPRWLKEEDEREGYYPPPPDWFDKFVLGMGIVALITSVGLWTAAVVSWLAPGLIGWQA